MPNRFQEPDYRNVVAEPCPNENCNQREVPESLRSHCGICQQAGCDTCQKSCDRCSEIACCSHFIKVDDRELCAACVTYLRDEFAFALQHHADVQAGLVEV